MPEVVAGAIAFVLLPVTDRPEARVATENRLRWAW